MAEPWREPFASSEPVRDRMSRQRREGTAPEVALRQALHALGLRYRLHQAPLPGLRRKADIVFRPRVWPSSLMAVSGTVARTMGVGAMKSTIGTGRRRSTATAGGISTRTTS